jgi:KTSC domain-containing protein
MPRIELQDVESSQIHSIGHDAETNTLAIRFYRGYGRDQKPGSLYHYQNFTADDFKAFKNAESIGKHFGAHIKPFADKFPFVCVEKEPPADDQAAAA